MFPVNTRLIHVLLNFMPPLVSPPTFVIDNSRVKAVLGPTNTGKTHYAIERMCAHATGMMGLPLRLLAREIYDRVVTLKGVHQVALITGEEKIIPPLPAYFICTVEAMPLERQVEFLAVDEIQLCGDSERGHVFTDRLLHARGRYETLFLGAQIFASLFRKLFPNGEIMIRERMSSLSYAGSKKLTRLPPRTAIVAFSTESVYAIAELIRRQRGGAAVVMGSLSPKTRNAQVALFQNREVDFLVATDAIGLGLNMDVDHVAFSALSKFDGRHVRPLSPQEVGQIAGRAGRFTNAGTFGVTGDCTEMDEDLIFAVENHRFLPLEAAQWRNRELSFTSLGALLASLAAQPNHPALILTKEALDEKTLRILAELPDIAAKITNPIALKVLWDVCQLPDFRKVGLDEHFKIVEFLFWSRLKGDNAIAEDWFLEQINSHKNTEGDVDTLSSRLSGMRTLSYMANRTNWLKRTDHWREQTRAIEESLSDALHAKLMQRFIDQRTSVLLKALRTDAVIEAKVGEDGAVMVEGQVLGHLRGLSFIPIAGDSFSEDRAVRAATHRAMSPLLIERLRELGQCGFKALKLKGRHIVWKQEPVATLTGHDPFSPKLKLMGDLDHPFLVQKAVSHLTSFVAQTSQKALKPLWKLKDAQNDESQSAAVRAMAFRLLEDHGLCLKPHDLKLTDVDKAALKAIGVASNRFIYRVDALKQSKSRALYAHLLGIGEKSLLCLTHEGQTYAIDFFTALDAIFQKGQWDKARHSLWVDAVALDTLSEKPDKLLKLWGYGRGKARTLEDGTAQVALIKKLERKPSHKTPKQKAAPPKPVKINPYSPFAILSERLH